MAEKRLNIHDIAQMAGTSTATVSNYLNGRFERMSEATRERIAQVVHRTGYVPSAQAKDLAGSSSHVIAVIILNNSNLWAGRVFTGIERVAQQAGYQTVICNTGFSSATERAQVEKMLSLGVDGFIIQPTSHHRELRRLLEAARKPVVFFDFGYADVDCSWVRTDLYGAVYDATSSCVERGYDDFVVCAAPPGKMRSRVERMDGMVDALAVRGLEARVVEMDENTTDVQALERKLDAAIAPARRTLVFCPHQWGLARLVKALRSRRHLMPERIGLLGINNEDWADLAEPGISTIIEPVEEEGELVCSILMGQLREPAAAPVQRILPCSTRWLASTL